MTTIGYKLLPNFYFLISHFNPTEKNKSYRKGKENYYFLPKKQEHMKKVRVAERFTARGRRRVKDLCENEGITLPL